MKIFKWESQSTCPACAAFLDSEDCHYVKELKREILQRKCSKCKFQFHQRPRFKQKELERNMKMMMAGLILVFVIFCVYEIWQFFAWVAS